jgi:uncharacterized protein (DUF1330 family)
MMTKAYLFANITVTNADVFARYRETVTAVIEKFGGRYLVRGGKVTDVEGKPGLDRVVVIEFPSVQDAWRFYESAEYAPLLQMRCEATQSRVAIVEGLTSV